MDGLRSRTRDLFDEVQLFKEQQTEQKLRLMTVHKYADGKTHKESESLTPTQIMDRETQTKKKHDSRDLVATMNLLRIEGRSSRIILLSKQQFMGLFEVFRLEQYWIYLAYNAVGGFYHSHCPLPPPKSGRLHNFYLRTNLYTLMWSYDTSDASTKAFIMMRLKDYKVRRDAVYGQFEKIMEYHMELIDDPRLISFVSGIQSAESFHESNFRQITAIREVEAETGHGKWVCSGGRSGPPTTLILAELSKRIGSSLATLATVPRQAHIIKRRLQDLQSPVAGSNATSASKLAEAAIVLEFQVDSAEKKVAYIQERARNQHAVIFNLLSREDANASQEIAAAAKQDTSAMKTIAVMTMVFLPGTFFAALFAVPLLQWQEQRVMDDRFWVYWAFTLPCTALVFFVWWGLGAKQGTTVAMKMNAVTVGKSWTRPREVGEEAVMDEEALKIGVKFDQMDDPETRFQ